MASVAKGNHLSYFFLIDEDPSLCPFVISYPQIMLRVCLLLPILLLAGAPLSKAQEEDQEVTEKNSSGQIYIVNFLGGFKNWQNLDASPARSHGFRT